MPGDGLLVLLNYRTVPAHVYDKNVPLLFENRFYLILLKTEKNWFQLHRMITGNTSRLL